VTVPLGEDVHGPAGVEAEIVRLMALAAVPTVTHLVVDPARLAPGGSDWSAEDDVARAAQALRPVLEAAIEHDTTVHLEPRSVRWARLVPDLVVRALIDATLDRARIGVRLMAELPESREHYDRLSRWAQRRVADGGAPAEVVIGVAGAAGAERIVSLQSGLAVSVLEDRREVLAQLLRLIELALHPGRAAVLRPVIASEDLLVLGGVAALAEHLDTAALCSVQLRTGVAPGLAETISGLVSEVRIAVPVIAPKEFAGAVDLLVGLVAEAADLQSAMSRLAALVQDPDLEGAPELQAEREVFRAAVALAAEPAPASHRTQRRAREWNPSERDSALFYREPDEPARLETGGLTAAVLGLTRGATGELTLEEFVPPRAIPVVSQSGFANEPETDAGVAANRDWARELLVGAAEIVEQRDTANETVALSAADLDPEHATREAHEAALRWADLPHAARASRLRRAALGVVAARDRLLQVLAADTGAPVAELDAEIDDIVDAARYCGQLAEGLAAVRGASFVPQGLVLVAADGSTPLSVQAEAVLAALGAGSGVLWSVPQRLQRSAAALLEEWQAGGLALGAVRLEAVIVGRTLAELAASPEIDRAVVLGDRAAARELARRRPDLRVEGRFHARGAILVTPAADLDRAVTDIVASGFRAAGSDPRAAHAVILLGSTARSRRFRDALADAVRALRVGDTARPGSEDPLGFDLGPLPAPPDEAGLRALTQLGRGEEWLVEPRRLDEEGMLWSPGVRLGVGAASSFWDDARGVPVIGVAQAHTLGEALAMQNAAGSGAVAGLQSNDADEILAWLDGIEAAAVSLNRPTTAARIERQPSGGWNDATMGLPALSGGPNRLVPLGSWRLRSGTRSDTLHLRGLDPEVQLLVEAARPVLDYEDFDEVRRAALSDALVWRTSFGAARDTIGLGIERNVIRYLPVTTQLRLAQGARVVALVRVLAAALLVRAPVSVSTGEVLPAELSAFLEQLGIEVSLERDDDWVQRLAVSGPVGADGIAADRVRLIGGDAVRAAEWMGGLDRAALWAEPVTMAGPVELLTLLREQSVSARAHRHGLAVPVPGLDEFVE
jgi:RHH-type proline utilization regulon transcriptional repressor/proline dehydrogenase/delta 1-pyrroline-5-carboxylate dehydrogenase